ncbi:MAG: hypothetical protein EBU23_16330 [Mycobacteriaceae bacterium]|nr:hypothetical protein [Mycobacteriaceae bacterium]
MTAPTDSTQSRSVEDTHGPTHTRVLDGMGAGDHVAAEEGPGFPLNTSTPRARNRAVAGCENLFIMTFPRSLQAS